MAADFDPKQLRVVCTECILEKTMPDEKPTEDAVLEIARDAWLDESGRGSRFREVLAGNGVDDDRVEFDPETKQSIGRHDLIEWEWVLELRAKKQRSEPSAKKQRSEPSE